MTQNEKGADLRRSWKTPGSATVSVAIALQARRLPSRRWSQHYGSSSPGTRRGKTWRSSQVM